MRRFKLIITVALVVASVCANAKETPFDFRSASHLYRDDLGHPSLDLVYHKIFFVGNDVSTQEFEFDEVPSVTALNLPFRSGTFSMIAIQCAGFTADGHLKDCEIGAYPGYEAAGQVLAEQLKVSAETIQSLTHPIRFIDIQAKVSNSDAAPTVGPCWPPSCVGMPPPPPPPKPLDDPQLDARYEAWEADWNAAQKMEAARLDEARAALARTPGFAPNSAEWLAARDAVIRYSESRERLDELRWEFRRFQSNAFPSASRGDQMQLAKVWDNLENFMCLTEKQSTDLLLSLID